MGSQDFQTPTSCDTRVHSTKLVATKQYRLKPGGLQNQGHATRTGVLYYTKIQDVHELRECTVDECDKLDQHFVDKVIGEWRKRLRASVVTGGGQFEHKM